MKFLTALLVFLTCLTAHAGSPKAPGPVRQFFNKICNAIMGDHSAEIQMMPPHVILDPWGAWLFKLRQPEGPDQVLYLITPEQQRLPVSH